MDFKDIIPINASILAKANADIKISVSNLQAAVSYDETEYESWLSLTREILLLRTVDPTFDACFDVNSIGNYSFNAQFFTSNNRASISTVNFEQNTNASYTVNYNTVSDIAKAFNKKILFNASNEGIWNLKINFDLQMMYSTQIIQFTDNFGDPVKIYMEPVSGASLFIDNNFDGINDLNQIITSSQHSGNISLSTSLALPVGPVFLALVLTSLVAIKRKIKK